MIVIQSTVSQLLQNVLRQDITGGRELAEDMMAKREVIFWALPPFFTRRGVATLGQNKNFLVTRPFASSWWFGSIPASCNMKALHTPIQMHFPRVVPWKSKKVFVSKFLKIWQAFPEVVWSRGAITPLVSSAPTFLLTVNVSIPVYCASTHHPDSAKDLQYNIFWNRCLNVPLAACLLDTHITGTWFYHFYNNLIASKRSLFCARILRSPNISP